MNRLLASCGVCAALLASGCSLIETLPQSADDVDFDVNAYVQDKRFSLEESLSFQGVEITDAYSSIIVTFSELLEHHIRVKRANYPSVILAVDVAEFGDLSKRPRVYGIYLKPVHGGVQIKVLIRGKKAWLNYDDNKFIDGLVNDLEDRKQPSRLLPEPLFETRDDDRHIDRFPISVQDVGFDPEYHGKKSLFGFVPYEETADFASYDMRSVFLAAVHSVERRGFIVQQSIYPSVLIARKDIYPGLPEGYDAVGIYFKRTSEGVQAKIIYASVSVFSHQQNAETLIANMRVYLSSDAQATDVRARYFPD